MRNPVKTLRRHYRRTSIKTGGHLLPARLLREAGNSEPVDVPRNMNTITDATKAKIAAARAADPARWETNGGNENGPREILIDGHDIAMATVPSEGKTYWYACDEQGRETGEGVIEH